MSHLRHLAKRYNIEVAAARHDMAFPNITKSGTDKDSLVNDYVEAIEALRVAGKKIGETSPNGRDYQGGDLNKAIQQHKERLVKIGNVMSELQMIAEEISNSE